jgi:hypothetical protein
MHAPAELIRAHEGDYVGAMADFNTVFEPDPNRSQALLGRGNTRLKRGKLLHHEALCKSALTDFNYAQSYGSNKYEKAEAHVGSAWALYAQRNHLMEYEIGQCAALCPDNLFLPVLRRAFESLGPINVIDIDRRNASTSTSRWDGGPNY